ncbi:MAG TPA: helix-turn-helix domain-containing protein [Pirellulales bacterium]|nr:helix-turn-helix domain-containing protein [Pirellulales bacterium]
MSANVLRLPIARDQPEALPAPAPVWRTIAEGYAPPAAADLAGRIDRLIALLELLVAQTAEAPSIVPLADDGELLIDQAELAEVLKLSLRSVRRMETAGELPPSVLSGRRRLYLKNEVERWLKHGRPPRQEWEARGRK